MPSDMSNELKHTSLDLHYTKSDRGYNVSVGMGQLFWWPTSCDGKMMMTIMKTNATESFRGARSSIVERIAVA